MTTEEFKRQERVADQMLTGYSILRDSYGLWAQSLDVGIIVASVIICALTFAEDKVLAWLLISALAGKVIVGLCSALVFAMSLVASQVKWKARSEEYSKAADTLARFKAECRNAYAADGQLKQECVGTLCEKYVALTDELPRIPDAKFARLKAKHLRKVELSKTISRYPLVPLWILRIHLMIRGIRELWRGETGTEGEK